MGHSSGQSVQSLYRSRQNPHPNSIQSLAVSPPSTLFPSNKLQMEGERPPYRRQPPAPANQAPGKPWRRPMLPPPRVYQVDSRDFRQVVQCLTGAPPPSPSSSTSHPPLASNVIRPVPLKLAPRILPLPPSPWAFQHGGFESNLGGSSVQEEIIAPPSSNDETGTGPTVSANEGNISKPEASTGF